MSARPTSHEPSLGDPTSIGHIPPEVVRKAFVHISAADLASCRVLLRLVVGNNTIEKVVCGLNLRRLVSFKTFPIKILDLDLGNSYSCIKAFANLLPPTISTLRLTSNGVSCFESLRVIFSNCERIRNLQLVEINFAVEVVDNFDMFRVIRKGLRLNRFDVIRCSGSIVILFELAYIPNLRWLRYEYNEDENNANAVRILFAVSKYPNLTSISLKASFNTSVGQVIEADLLQTRRMSGAESR
jgi:hypothetical protein